MKRFGKTAGISAVTAFLAFAVSTAIAGEVNFTSYTSNTNGMYTYNQKPLGCNYSSAAERTLTGNGKDWAMSTVITGWSMRDGNLLINGTTTLSDASVITGFTGGTFIVAKDSMGFVTCVINAKTNTVISQAFATNSDAEIYGWGVNPGAVAFYKWKPYIKPGVRTCPWQVTIPSYIMSINPTISVVQCHTPSNRALRELNEIAKYVLSFTLSNGLDIANLIYAAQNNTLTFPMVADFMNDSISWAQTQQLITSVQANAATNIVNAIVTLEKQGLIGIQPKNYGDLVTLASAVQKAVSGTGTGIDSAKGIISALQPLLQNQQGIVPPDLSSIIIILQNMEVLLQSKLNSNEIATFNQVIAVLNAINNLPPEPVWSHIDLVFDAITAIMNISSSGTVTPAIVQSNLTPLLNKVGLAISAQYGTYSRQMEYFNGFMEIYSNIFKIIANGNNGWTSENLTIVTNGISILLASIENKQLSMSTLTQFSDCVMSALVNNNGWSFENSEALVGIIDGLEIYVQSPVLIQLKNTLSNMQKNN